MGISLGGIVVILFYNFLGLRADRKKYTKDERKFMK